MAHNSYIRAGAVWAATSVMLSAEAAALDLAQFKSLNADDGGTWAPSSIIVLGGFGMRVTGPFIADDADVTIPNGKSLTILGGGHLTAVGGSFVTFQGSVKFDDASVTHVDGAGMTPAQFFIDNHAIFAMNGVMTMASTGTLVAAASSTITVDGTLVLGSGSAGASQGLFIINPHAVVTFQGLSATTFQSTSTLTLAGTIHFTSSVAVDSVSGGPAWSLQAPITIPTGGALSFTGVSTCSFASPTTCTFDGTVVLGADCTLNSLGGSTVNLGTTNISGNLAISGATTITGTTTYSGTTGYVNIRHQVGLDADHTYDAREMDIIEVPTLATVPRVWTLKNLGAGDRVILRINAYINAFGQDLAVKDIGANPIVTFTAAVGAAEVFWNGSKWARQGTSGSAG